MQHKYCKMPLKIYQIKMQHKKKGDLTVKKKGDPNMSIKSKNGKTDLEKLKGSEIVNVRFLLYELISFQDESKAVGSMALEEKDFESVKQQIRNRKDKIVFNMKGSDWPMSINTDKYSRVWVEIIPQRIAKGQGGTIIDPKTGQPAIIEEKNNLKN